KLKLTVTELKAAMKARLKEIESAAANVEAQSALQKVKAQDPRDMLTDTWNGARFAREHHERVRYVIELGQWAVWDGRRWRISNDTTTVEALAKETVLGIGELMGEALKNEQLEQLEALTKHAKHSLSAERRAAVLKTARSEKSIVVSITEFDRD